jgi:hypothetical protein
MRRHKLDRVFKVIPSFEQSAPFLYPTDFIEKDVDGCSELLQWFTQHAGGVSVKHLIYLSF